MRPSCGWRSGSSATASVYPTDTSVRSSTSKHWGSTRLVERRTGMPCRVVVDEDRVKMHYPGNILVEPSLPGLAVAEKLALAERLVREGFLAIASADNGLHPAPDRRAVG